MSLNCNELNAILSELDLDYSFIQEIVQPGFDTLAFRAFKQGVSHTILICTSANACRINETQKKIPKNEKPLRFNEFLKSRMMGARINSVKQLGLDRIVKFNISYYDEQLYLFVRLWSGAANVIVTDDKGIIQDCMFRRPAKGEVTGGVFNPEEKEVTDEERTASLQKFPVRAFSELQNADTLTFNQKVDLFYSEHAVVLSRESLLVQAEKWYNVKHSKMKSALDKLMQKKLEFANAEKLKHTGDLILSYGAQADGTSLDCIDYDTGKQVHIRLDAHKSMQENAAIYYDQYKKAVSGMDALEHDISLSQKNLSTLDEEYQSMLSEKNVLKLEQMLRHDTTPKQKSGKPHAGLHYEIDGWTIIVGRTAAENDDLLRHTVRGPDMWLHARDYSGGYVFIKARSGKTVPLEILLYAGNLAVYHSKARRNGQADLYYTEVKYLRRAKDGPKGLVLPTHEKNLLIKLDEEKLRKLDELEKTAEGI
jgi:predicted ribosome quality control (RQC) complex YloA/Tae2 family protein